MIQSPQPHTRTSRPYIYDSYCCSFHTKWRTPFYGRLILRCGIHRLIEHCVVSKSFSKAYLHNVKPKTMLSKYQLQKTVLSNNLLGQISSLLVPPYQVATVRVTLPNVISSLYKFHVFVCSSSIHIIIIKVVTVDIHVDWGSSSPFGLQHSCRQSPVTHRSGNICQRCIQTSRTNQF